MTKHFLWLPVALLMASLLAGCGADGPAASAEQFFRLVEEGELDQAAAMVSGDALSLGPDKLKAALAEQTRKINEKGGIESIEVLEEEIQGQVAAVRLRLTYGNGESQVEAADMTKIDGEWKLTPSMEK